MACLQHELTTVSESTHAIEVVRQHLALRQQKIGHQATFTIIDKSHTGKVPVSGNNGSTIPPGFRG